MDFCGMDRQLSVSGEVGNGGNHDQRYSKAVRRRD